MQGITRARWIAPLVAVVGLAFAAPALAKDAPPKGGTHSGSNGDLSTIVSNNYTVTAGNQAYGYAQCPDSGDNYVTGGGFYGSAPYPAEEANSSYPIFNSTGGDYWNVFMDNYDAYDWGFNVYAVCRPFQ